MIDETTKRQTILFFCFCLFSQGEMVSVRPTPKMRCQTDKPFSHSFRCLTFSPQNKKRFKRTHSFNRHNDDRDVVVAAELVHRLLRQTLRCDIERFAALPSKIESMRREQIVFEIKNLDDLSDLGRELQTNYFLKKQTKQNAPLRLSSHQRDHRKLNVKQC